MRYAMINSALVVLCVAVAPNLLLARAVTTSSVVNAHRAEIELARDTWHQKGRAPTAREREALWDRLGVSLDDIRVFRRGDEQDLVEQYIAGHPEIRRRLEALQREVTEAIAAHTDIRPLTPQRYVAARIAVLALQRQAWRQRGTAAPAFAVRQRLSAHDTNPESQRAYGSRHSRAIADYLVANPEQAERVASLSADIRDHIDALE